MKRVVLSGSFMSDMSEIYGDFKFFCAKKLCMDFVLKMSFLYHTFEHGGRERCSVGYNVHWLIFFTRFYMRQVFFHQNMLTIEYEKRCLYCVFLISYYIDLGFLTNGPDTTVTMQVTWITITERS